MHERVHAVVLHGHTVGAIHHRGDVTRFVLSDSYWRAPNRAVLGMQFEDNPRAGAQVAMRLPVWFSNLLPEGDLRNWIAYERGVSAQREVELLLKVGRDLPGAVQVIEDGGDDFDASGFDHVEPPSSQDLDTEQSWKFSLAGMGLKFSMLQSGGRLTAPASDKLGDWIVKMPDGLFPDVPRNEYAMMQLASEVGIDVPQTRLIHRDDLSAIPSYAWRNSEAHAYAVTRFDRAADGSRVHIEDFAQIRGFYPQDKYRGSFESIGALIFRNRDNSSFDQFLRRVIFNLLIGNGDGHLKNWSMIYRDRRRPELAPAYDLVSTACYIRHPDIEDFGLRIGREKNFNRIGFSNIKRLQRKVGADEFDVEGTLDDTISRFVAAWSAQTSTTLGSIYGRWITANLEDAVNRLKR